MSILDKIFRLCFAIFVGASLFFSGYNIYYSGKILPRVFVGAINISGLNRGDVFALLNSHLDFYKENGIKLLIDGNEEIIDPTNIDLSLPVESLMEQAWSVGRSGMWYEQIFARISRPFYEQIIPYSTGINEKKLRGELELLASAYNVERTDVRYSINGVEVDILYDTKAGKKLDVESALERILSSLFQFNTKAIRISLNVDSPVADPIFGELARSKAQSILAEPIVFSYRQFKFELPSDKIGAWIISEYDSDQLVPGLNKKLISEYVLSIAEKIDSPPVNASVKVEDGKVVEFTPPKQGRVLSQDETIDTIVTELRSRASGSEFMEAFSLPVVIKKPFGEGDDADLGIIELVGKATTPFTGSPQNRVHNIKNGVRFLTGFLVPPGEEFSTVGSLGTIDNTTGYLPELVIKGDETIPEFGGGLCQVSTTLFRSVMNAGLPVVERRNHSYRVPYYERDGEGNFIGPGLDATIYDPWPDFKFKNDTSAHLLIQGFVEGDKVTFELYGTDDGRKSVVDGPTILEETDPPEPVYIETNKLPLGEKKKIDTAHPGGVAVATYTVEYSDGRVEEQEFKSYYRKWPEKWLVGTATSTTPAI